ncbi:MAG: hypothetical protein A4E28_01064 [Methanocella sp. PtaU1.Bin125]|nr:MAG: hypothetical protein A4E28_01064 [Methanocella sp. PtaU1.Bin125]
MRQMEKLAVILFLLSVISFPQAASAQMPTATPDPGDSGLIADIVHVSSDTASWLSGRAVEYAGSPLWSTLAGVFIIAIIVCLFLWLRRPKKPVEARAPM